MRQELDTHVSVRQAICEAPFRTPQFAVLRQSSLRFLGVQGMGFSKGWDLAELSGMRRRHFGTDQDQRADHPLSRPG